MELESSSSPGSLCGGCCGAVSPPMGPSGGLTGGLPGAQPKAHPPNPCNDSVSTHISVSNPFLCKITRLISMSTFKYLLTDKYL